MKKMIYGAVLAAAMLAMLTGCGDTKGNDDTTENNNTTGTQTEATTQTPSSEGASGTDTQMSKTSQEIADAVLAGGTFSENLQPLSQQVALNRLYAIDEELIENSAFYTNSQATAEEIAVIKVKSADHVSEVKESFAARVEDQKTACTDYLPDEIPKLEKAVIYENGNYIILCISVDSDKAKTVVEELFQ